MKPDSSLVHAVDCLAKAAAALAEAAQAMSIAANAFSSEIFTQNSQANNPGSLSPGSVSIDHTGANPEPYHSPMKEFGSESMRIYNDETSKSSPKERTSEGDLTNNSYPRAASSVHMAIDSLQFDPSHLLPTVPTEAQIVTEPSQAYQYVGVFRFGGY